MGTKNFFLFLFRLALCGLWMEPCQKALKIQEYRIRTVQLGRVLTSTAAVVRNWVKQMRDDTMKSLAKTAHFAQ